MAPGGRATFIHRGRGHSVRKHNMRKKMVEDQGLNGVRIRLLT